MKSTSHTMIPGHQKVVDYLKLQSEQLQDTVDGTLEAEGQKSLDQLKTKLREAVEVEVATSSSQKIKTMH